MTSSKPYSVIDAETDPFKHGRTVSPFIWGRYDERGFTTFRSTAELAEAMRKDKRVYYAHNGGKFDFHFLLDHVDTGREMTVINGRIAKARIGQAEIRDSYLILPESLDKITHGKKIVIDYAKFEASARNAHWREIVTYLERDCSALYTVLGDFFEAHPKRPLTLAGAAMEFWVSNWRGSKPKMAQSAEGQKHYFDSLQAYYFGGRVQALKIGYFRGKIRVYDINSAYPAAMLHDHPAGPHRFSADKSVSPQKIYRVVTNHPGLFPRRGKATLEWGAKGEFFITGWELIAARELGAQVTIEEAWEFAGRETFGPYVDYWHKRKQGAQKDSFERLEAKLFLNSLYGKYGQNPSEYSRHFLVGVDEIPKFLGETGGQIITPIGNNFLLEAPILPEQMRYYDVAVALSITGYVRAQLMHAVNANDTYYCDTDCVHVAGEPRGLVLGKNLGQWCMEFEGDEAAYAGPKMYALRNSKTGETKWASKGVQLPEGREFETIREIAEGGEYDYHRVAPTFSLKYGQRFIERKIRRAV